MVNAVNLFMTCYYPGARLVYIYLIKQKIEETARICQLVTFRFEWWRRNRKLADGGVFI